MLAPGSLRALFAERRADVSPLSLAEVAQRGEGATRLGYRTRKVEVQGRAGRGVFEVVRLADLGDGGALFVRALLNLMSVAPQTMVVAADELPLHGELHWPSRGALFFDVTSIAKRNDLGASAMAVPPSFAAFTMGPLPPTAGEVRVDAKDLSGIHATTPESGSLVLMNAHETPRFAWIDGAPIAWVAPEGRVELASLPRGRYQLECAHSSTTPPTARSPSASPRRSEATRELVVAVTDSDASVHVGDSRA